MSSLGRQQTCQRFCQAFVNMLRIWQPKGIDMLEVEVRQAALGHIGLQPTDHLKH